MRIIAGQFRSRQLAGTPPPGLRPTSDRLRETLFNILGSSVENADFLDACAGLGGVGLEAISRGAHMVHFVDVSRKAADLIRRNLSQLGVRDGFQLHITELGKALDQFVRERVAFDIAFLDPPYDREDLYTIALTAFGGRALLKDHGILVIEHSKRDELAETAGSLQRYRLLKQGDSCLSFYRAQS